jgi:hypothetical protein
MSRLHNWLEGNNACGGCSSFGSPFTTLRTTTKGHFAIAIGIEGVSKVIHDSIRHGFVQTRDTNTGRNHPQLGRDIGPFLRFGYQRVQIGLGVGCRHVERDKVGYKARLVVVFNAMQQLIQLCLQGTRRCLERFVLFSMGGTIGRIARSCFCKRVCAWCGNCWVCLGGCRYYVSGRCYCCSGGPVVWYRCEGRRISVCLGRVSALFPHGQSMCFKDHFSVVPSPVVKEMSLSRRAKNLDMCQVDCLQICIYHIYH